MASQAKTGSFAYNYRFEPTNNVNSMLLAGIEGILNEIQQEKPECVFSFLLFLKENIREVLPILETRQSDKRHIIITDSVMLPFAYFFASRNRTLCIIEPSDAVHTAQMKIKHCLNNPDEYDIYRSSLKPKYLKIFRNFFSGMDAHWISSHAGVSLKRTYGIRKEVENKLGITVRKLRSCS